MKIKKVKLFGNQTPWVWVLEPVHGCNLKCGHCCAGLLSKNTFNFMSKETWINTWNIIKEVSPTCRIDICGIVGEPSLHPDILEFIRIAREISPLSQIQITTNGSMIRSGRLKFKDMLDCGLNIIYTDQYGSKEMFEKLANESGYSYYQYYNKPKDMPSPWTYIGPELKIIVLQEQPDNWPESRFKAGLLGNWYGNLDWERAKKYKMKPLEKPLTRRCNQPFLYANVSSEGKYLLCCQDGMQVTKNKFGSVNSGLNGFKSFWFGKEMQLIRRRLRNKDRAGTEYACAKCNITFSRCDFKHWKDEEVSRYYDGKNWSIIDES